LVLNCYLSGELNTNLMRLPACACWKIVVFILSAFIPVSIFAQHVSIKPAPAWVTQYKPDVTAKPDARSAASSYYLLIDKQDHVPRQMDFRHYAYKLLTTEGVQQMSDISVSFDPSFQKLIFHQCVIHRDGKTIDKLKPGNIRTIQREESMDRYLYDGSLSAVINLQDVRTGDIVEYAFSIEGYNPVYEGHYTNTVYFDFTVPYEQFEQRIIFPGTEKLYTKSFNKEVKPEIQDVGSSTEYRWSLHRGNAVTGEDNEPSWYEGYRFVQITDFKEWSEVAIWAAKQFEVSEAERKQLKSRTDELFNGLDKPGLIQKAIRFVQDEVRYLGFESGLNSHRPHAPVDVFEQRFGDCKDKSLLLSSILNIYGVEAYPMLVSTTLRDHTSERLPSHTIFNHCVVKVEYDGKSIFIDPTISNQGGTFEDYYFPTYGLGLVVNKDSKTLLTLPGPGTALIKEEQTFDILELGGAAIFSVKTIYKGVEADIQRSDFASRSINQIQKDYIAFYANLYADIVVVDTVRMEDNRQENIVTIYEKYKVPGLWTTKEGEPEKLNAEFYPLTLENHFSIPKSQSRNAPYKLSFPLSYEHNIRVNLPESWNIKTDSKSIETAYYKYDYHASYDADSSALILQTLYKTKKDHIPDSAMQTFVDDHAVMMKNLSYNIFYDKSVSNASGIGWFSIFISLFTLYISVKVALHLYQHYDPKPELINVKGKPIGGFLVLMAIGLVIAPLVLIHDLLNTIDFYYQKMWLPFLRGEQYGLIVALCLRLVHDIISVIFSLLLVLLFFERRSSFPKLIAIFFALNVVVALIDCFIELMYLDVRREQQVGAFLRVLGGLFVGAIWIPYFNVSTRVRETFVVRSGKHKRSHQTDVPVEADAQQT